MDIAERFRLLQLEGNEEELRMFLLSNSGGPTGEPLSGGGPEVDVPGLPGYGSMPDPDWQDPRPPVRLRAKPAKRTASK